MDYVLDYIIVSMERAHKTCTFYLIFILLFFLLSIFTITIKHFIFNLHLFIFKNEDTPKCTFLGTNASLKYGKAVHTHTHTHTNMQKK